MLNPRQARTILVVDDSATMRAGMCTVLSREGFQVVEALDGMEALSVLSGRTDIALVLTDLNMPVIDGIALLRKIRGDPERSLLPVIIQSSEAQGTLIALGKQAGATAWLVKPYSEEKLLLTVRRLLP